MGKIIPELFREIIQNASIKFQTPAISVAVIEDGEISFAEGFGSRTFGKNEEVTADTSYAIASMSKSTVSTSLAILREQNLFGWDDKVTKFLPDFRMADLFAGQEMTVLDLLIH
ncbi:MAG TPA: serine hydrolase domain-containing protein, partial [Flexilinea sp.]|nr:serine hydrolase domain-containing protein [Flexilinea sp.]